MKIILAFALTLILINCKTAQAQNGIQNQTWNIAPPPFSLMGRGGLTVYMPLEPMIYRVIPGGKIKVKKKNRR
jgi:hypothetical protein